VALAGGVCALNGVLKWVVGRQRPITHIAPFDFEFFTGGLHGLFSGKNLCFPSGHACMAFTTATAVGICLPRWRILFYAIALVVAAERIYENAHYLSDVVAGAGLGWLSAHATRWVLERLARRTRPAALDAPLPVAARAAKE
jgi:membrane-associated phospholipid phosphatase